MTFLCSTLSRLCQFEEKFTLASVVTAVVAVVVVVAAVAVLFYAKPKVSFSNLV